MHIFLTKCIDSLQEAIFYPFLHLHLSHLADAFIQSDLQMSTIKHPIHKPQNGAELHMVYFIVILVTYYTTKTKQKVFFNR